MLRRLQLHFYFLSFLSSIIAIIWYAPRSGDIKALCVLSVIVAFIAVKTH